MGSYGCYGAPRPSGSRVLFLKSKSIVRQEGEIICKKTEVLDQGPGIRKITSWGGADGSIPAMWGLDEKQGLWDWGLGTRKTWSVGVRWLWPVACSSGRVDGGFRCDRSRPAGPRDSSVVSHSKRKERVLNGAPTIIRSCRAKDLTGPPAR
jgi:hypothetical protein